jgi:hypothetical protein
VNLSLVFVLGGLTILTAWGFVAPRSQWRALTGWSRREPSSGEPGALIVGILRCVAGIALAALAVGGASMVGGTSVAGGASVAGGPLGPSRHSSERTITDPVRLLWGTPDPVVVNRVFVPVNTPPTGLTRTAVLRYQAVSPKNRSPSYLFSLSTYARPHASATDDYLGADPTVGLTALDTANIVVQVRADSRCIPQQVFVVESNTAIALAVYYGRPAGESLDAKALATPCDAKAVGDRSSSVLIPIDLGAAIGDRAVLNLEGTSISKANAG